MLEINIPEVSLNKIREKILNQLNSIDDQKNSDSLIDNLNLKTIQEQIQYIQGFINTAKSRAEIRDNWPNSLNKFPFILLKPFAFIFFNILKFLFKDQREVNFNVLQALEESIKVNTMLLEQINNINSNTKDDLYTFQIICSDLIEKSQQLKDKINHLEEQTKNIDNIEEKQKEYFYKNIYLQADLNQQKRLINIFLEEFKPSSSETLPESQIAKLKEEEQHYLDAFYLAFENQFRGDRENIKIQQQQDYLSLLQTLNLNPSQSLIIDIGCGRGEWLELLKDSGYNPKGIDTNQVMIEECNARGLDVLERDCLDYLKSISDESVEIITGFHIIEHLPFKTLFDLFTEALRILKSNGLIIFETPNPDNVLVGSRNFYLDPTHRNPLPSDVVKFIAESTGFTKVEILNLHPISKNQHLQGGKLAERFNQYFYCSQDYAVIGYKL